MTNANSRRMRSSNARALSEVSIPRGLATRLKVGMIDTPLYSNDVLLNVILGIQ